MLDSLNGVGLARGTARWDVFSQIFAAIQGTIIGKAIELAPLSRAGRDPTLPVARVEFKDGLVHQWLRGTVTLLRLETGRLVKGAYAVTCGRSGMERHFQGAVGRHQQRMRIA